KLALFSYPYHMPASTPLILLPMEVERKKPPIISAVRRGGLSLDTSERPIGLKRSSPIVITPYVPTSHQGDTFISPLELAYTAPTITKVESPEMTRPRAILVGVVGSFFRLRSQAKKPTTRGVRSTTHIGLID